MNVHLIHGFNSSIVNTFRTAQRLVSKTAILPAAIRTITYQKKASQRRAQWLKEGLHVPPLLIFSVTKRCNLRCIGCYHHAQQRENHDLSIPQIRTFFEEASELGVSIIVLAGGEPLLRTDLLSILPDYPEILFPLFTNGLIIDEAHVQHFQEHRNIVPIISLEGDQAETDTRRGRGIYTEILQRFHALDDANIFFGASITVTRANVDTVMRDEFVRDLTTQGVQVLVYVEYVPLEAGTEHMVLTLSQRERLTQRLVQLRRDHPALIINFPGDEEKLGGCLAAGRGFLHISQDGSVEPCPAAPYSDTNLKDTSLKNALTSTFLKTIRNTPHSLMNSASGCVLFDKKAWIKSLLTK